MNAQEQYLQFRDIRHFGSLDALRCIAISGVIWQHSPPLPHEHLPFTDAGAAGVGLFFVLSGFLITTLLLREESATGTINLRNFYARRTLRIFPLYYAVLALYTVLVLLLENNAAGRLFFSNLPYYLTYTSNWFVDLALNEDGQRRVIFVFAWSLATEEQFYLLWPFVLKYFRRHWAITALLAVMLADLLLTFTLGRADLPTSPSERLLRIATSPSTEIFAGVLLAIGLHSETGFRILSRALGHRWSAPITGLVAASIMVWPGESTPAWYLMMAVAFVFFLGSCVIREDHGVAWLLNSRVLARIGVVSYGMYMLHMLAVNTVKAGFGRFGFESAPLKFALAFCLTYVAAEISFRILESPLLRLKKRFESVGPATSDKR